jgi:NAD+ synthase
MMQGPNEFYFAVPYDKMGIALLAHNRLDSSSMLAAELITSGAQAEIIYRDIEAKRKTTASLHWPGIPVEKLWRSRLPSRRQFNEVAHQLPYKCRGTLCGL